MKGFRMRLVAALIVALATLAGSASGAHAQLWFSPAQRVLFSGRTPAEVRARLAAHADSVLAHAPGDAGESFGWIGESQMRSGHPDSARAAYAHAYALTEEPAFACGLAEALLASRRPADAESAARFVAALPADEPDAAHAESRLWRTWAHARLAGAQATRDELDAARAELLAPGTPLDRRERWTRRLAPLWLEAHVDAWPLLLELAVLSRGHDPALLLQAREASMGRPGGESFERVLAAGIARRDSLSTRAWRAAGGRPLAVRGADGAALGAWLFPVAAPHAPLLALLAEPDPAPGAGPDSLVAQLQRDGIAVALLDPRGSGRSAIAGCALADDWSGREDALTATTGRDLLALVKTVVAAGRMDPARIAVGAVGPGALAAARAGHPGPLVLIDAVLAPTDRGPCIAALNAGGGPVYFQTGGGSVEGNWTVDAIAGRMRGPGPRVAESLAPGHGLALFRGGPKATQRLSSWLRDAWSKPRATRPARPR